MKIDLEQSDIQAIAQEVTKLLKPLLTIDTQGEDTTLFTVESLAEYLNVSKQWVYEKVHINDIPHYKIGKYPRFRRTKIDEWLGKREKGTRKV